MGKTVTSSVITPSWGQGDPSGPFPDTRSGTLAGRDHITGNPVVTTPGASSPTVGNVGAGGKVGTSVTLRVLNPSSGGRSVEVTTGTTGSTSKKVTSFVTTKTSVSTTTKPECDTRTPPPKKDPPEDDPEEPGKPPQGDGPISPPIPAPSDSPPTTGNPGCEPTSNTKWFAGSCPPGTQSLGSATLADGSVRSLCKGPSGKPSGCEPPAKWVCDSTIGSCVKSSTGGGYDSFEACMGAGCKRLRFSCIDGQCVENEGGEFPTYDACMSGGCSLNPISLKLAFAATGFVNGGTCATDVSFTHEVTVTWTGPTPNPGRFVWKRHSQQGTSCGQWYGTLAVYFDGVVLAGTLAPNLGTSGDNYPCISVTPIF